MAFLKPWHKIVEPREDLREGKPLDASEFAVHLDQVRDRRAPAVYQRPEQFFTRTYLTQNLTGLAAEAVRRLSGLKTETSPVFNMTTQFGGGKTHALTLLYHLAQHGPASHAWSGVRKILDRAAVPSVPEAATAVFVGNEFDSLSGRGGQDGAPIRKTPWGEIAFQLAGKAGLEVLAAHEEQMIAPAGDVIRRFLPERRPCLILMDELMNYVSRSRKMGMAAQLYNFLQNLSEEARGRDNLVLVASIPASELEMSAEDQSDYERFKKLLDRVGKAVFISAEAETSEIIRRRLFDWDDRVVSQDGRVLLSKDATAVCNEYAAWVVEHRQQLPSWFPVDQGGDAFQNTYPFHPMTLSVFERKWRALPRFQQTRGVLRVLALWVSRAYQEATKKGPRDALIGLGGAPLDDSLFRAALFGQLGEDRLEAPVTTDICGKKDSHAVRLDLEAVETIQKARLHQKVATAIFFESNGGQAHAEATIPELRLAVGEPGMDIGNIETAVDALSSGCYYLTIEKNKYRFSLSPNLNKLLADRRASVSTARIDERIRAEIQKIFSAGPKIEKVFFPEKSNQIPDRAVVTLVILDPELAAQDERTRQAFESLIKEYGSSARRFKSALIACAADGASGLREEARKLLAWEDIQNEDAHRLDAANQTQLTENLKKVQRDLRESVWRSYKNVMLLDKNGNLHTHDLGLVHSSAADSLTRLILNRLVQGDDVSELAPSPNFLLRNWPPAFREWSTQSVRDVFYAAPKFPRLLNPELVKETIAKGVAEGMLAYVGKSGADDYEPVYHATSLAPRDIEISNEMFIISRETLVAYKKSKETPPPPQPARPEPALSASVPSASLSPKGHPAPDASPPPLPESTPTETQNARKIAWTGSLPVLKWMNFYQKVLTRFATNQSLRLTLTFEAEPEGGLSKQKIEETKAALRELGLDDRIKMD